MDHFEYRNSELFAENVSVQTITEQYGTPCYIYSRATIERHWHAFNDALNGFKHLVCYAVKANSNLAVLNLMARLGSGFDIVSAGELERVLKAGGDPQKIVFSGVGKTRDELARALDRGIRCFNIESEAELHCLNDVAKAKSVQAPISIRVNPDVDAGTHPYISTGLKENKFGIDINSALYIYESAAQMSNIQIVGVDCHIGSQLTEIAPFVDAMQRVLRLVDTLAERGIHLDHIDLGGGLGICYNDEKPPLPHEWALALSDVLGERNVEIIIEPGRAIVGNAGILVTKIEYLKTNADKEFAVVDAAMNDLIRPSLYDAWQEIIPVQLHMDGSKKSYDIVGPICETGDFLGKDRELNCRQGDLLAVRSSGAYGFTMSSNYNSRPRVAEIMVDGEHAYLVRERETLDQLWMGEAVLP